MHSFWEGKCFPCIIIAVTITIILLTVGSVGSIKPSKGTKNKSVKELEEAIQNLGASIFTYATKENITISATTLTKNYNKTLDLIKEILLTPRFDENEFSLLKKATITRLRQQEANPNSVARNLYNQLIFGEDNIRSKNVLGTLASVEKIKLDDLKEYYNKFISPSITKVLVVGNIKQDKIISSINSMSKNWEVKEVTIPEYKTPDAPKKPTVYFYDVPNAKQSVLSFGAPALAATDKEYYDAQVMNYILGGGGFASRLTQELREGKGYTYGIRSGFSGTKAKGTFTISSSNSSTSTTSEALSSTQLTPCVVS